MAWNVNQIYQLTRFLTDKNQSGSITAGDLALAWNSEQTAYHKDLLGRWQSRSNGKAGANTGLPLNETILQELSPFTRTSALTITSGVVIKPADFADRLAVMIGTKDVTIINPSQKASVLKSVINPPSVADGKYYGIEYGNSYALLPNTATGVVQLDYIAFPVDIVWGFTLDGNNRQVYSAGASVQPQWAQSEIITITKRTLKSFGIRFKDADFSNFGNTAVATGE